MRLIWFLLFSILFSDLMAQVYFPVKREADWFLVNEEGEFWKKDTLDAVHLYDSFGYFIFQKADKVGLISRNGELLIPASKTDIRPLNEAFVEFSEQRVWCIGDIEGNIIYKKEYQAVNAIDSDRIKVKINNKWGCLDKFGEFIVRPEYDLIDWDKDGFYIVQQNSKLGVISEAGDEILQADYDEIIFLVDNGFAFRKEGLWGFCNASGSIKTAVKYQDFKKFSDGFLKLQEYQESGFVLLSLNSFKIAPVQNMLYAFPYSNGAVVFSKKSGSVGLIDRDGNIVLSPIYQEIAGFSEDYFRVKQNNLWSVVGKNSKVLYPLEYNYISAPNKNTCKLIKSNKCAIGTLSGKVISDFEFDAIKWGKQDQIHAFKGESLFIFYEEQEQLVGEQSFSQFLTIKVGTVLEEQILKDGYNLKNFEWVFVADKNKWGLRYRENETFKIDPQFDEIRVFDDLGFTLSSIKRSVPFEISKVDFQFLNVFGLVNNSTGICSSMELVHIFFEDFEGGSDQARCIFSDLSFGLVNRDGYYSSRRYKYLGPFVDGLAAAADSGNLSGGFEADFDNDLGQLKDFLGACLSNSRMIDYTEYAINFQKSASLFCESCNWGFIDEKGDWEIPAIYDFSKKAGAGIGIVVQQGKWGAVRAKGQIVLDFSYDSVDFLKVGDSAMLKVQQDDPRFGILDHDANELVPFEYEEFGAFVGDRIAVKKNGLWGFIDKGGKIVIGCAFDEVKSFSEGFAAVRKGNKWGFINTEGDLILGFDYNRCGSFKEGKCWVYLNSKAYYIDRSGAQVFAAVFASATDFDGGVARVKESGKYGLIDEYGNYILRPKYLKISSFNEYGLAVVESTGTSNTRFSLVNRSGALISSLKFTAIRSFQEGYAAVKIKKHWGFVNTNGRLVVPTRYFSVGDFTNGRASVYKDGRCGYIDYRGDLIIGLLYNNCGDFESNKAVVKLPRLRDGLINRDGTVLIKPSINTLFSFSEGRGLVRDKSLRYYFISENANMYDGFYQSAQKFKHGVAPVKRREKWGLINLKGMWVSRPKYNQIERLDNGLILAKINGYMGLTNLNGEFLTPLKYLQLDISKENIFLMETSNGIDYLKPNGEWIWQSN